jgi:hypothetical protein
VILATETSLLLRYVTADDAVAVIRFPLVHIFQFGEPNDEALRGHPLSKSGLQFYSVQRVENSPWLQELERRNSLHPQHDRDRFLEDKVHYIFTFQDSTLECVATEREHWKPQVQVCASKEEADRLWREGMGR